MINTSTFTGNFGEIADQIMGCSDGYYQYLKARSDAHVELYYTTYQHLNRRRSCLDLKEQSNQKQ
jgi:hypothetical protein